MPPSPIITAAVNERLYDQLIGELSLKAKPHVVIKRSNQQKWEGTILWTSPPLVTLYIGLVHQETEQLRFVAGELSRTLLHELRHAWQVETHGMEWMEAQNKMPYHHRPKEIDAEDFADKQIHRYRMLVRASRKFPSSPFTRLARTESNVRHSV